MRIEGNHDLFAHILHSWVGYELVKVLLAFGLSPKLRDDLNDWSLDLFNVFSYLGDKQRDSSKKDEAERLLQILFNKTEHISYFGKLPFGKKTKIVKMENTTIPLVILTWLRQLQEHFYQEPTISPSIDWNDIGRYCNTQQKHAVKKGVNNIHMSKAAATSLRKITSFDDIKQNKKDSDKVVKSLYDWAVMILHRDIPYVQDITKSIEGKKKNKTGGARLLSNYTTIRDNNYLSTDWDDYINVEIKKVAQKQQQHKTKAQLMENVCNFMITEIAKNEK